MKVIILGGTGLIGYHTTLALMAKGHQVTILSRGSINLEDRFHDEVEFLVGDVFKMENNALIKLFSLYDAMVYAIGPDDREVPSAPANDFFSTYLVIGSERICKCARTAKIQSTIILNSFFTYFNRVHPIWNLTTHHPYISARVEQSKRCLALAQDKFKVVVLEIPYVFGTMPKRDPLWKNQLVRRLNILKPLLVFTSGGTAMTTVNYMGEAVRGALEVGKTGTYVVGEKNMSWKKMLAIARLSLGGFKGKLITIPSFLAQIYGHYEKLTNKWKGNEAGLDYPKYIRDIQCKYTYFPEEIMEETAKELDLVRGDLNQAMKETFNKCK